MMGSMTTLYVLFIQNPSPPNAPSSALPKITYCGAVGTFAELEPLLDPFSSKTPGDVLLTARFTGEQAESIQADIDTLEFLDEQEGIAQIERTLERFLFPNPDVRIPDFDGPDFYDESMDGDATSALADAGMGTDEDYERFNDGDN